MRLKHFRRLLPIRFKRPIVVVKGAAENNSIASWKHVSGAGDVAVVNLRLRQEHFQLTPYWTKFLISKKCARPQPGTIENHRLGEAHDLFTILKVSNNDLSA